MELSPDQRCGIGENRAREALLQENIWIFDVQTALANIYRRSAGEIQIVNYDSKKREISFRIDEEKASGSVSLDRVLALGH